MRSDFSLYTTDYISGVMSLRKPQKKSLEILHEILSNVNLKKGMNQKVALGAVHALCPTCTDFEREFMSLTFALATGVGKTRLMGAFITYLYTQHGIRNFFVVAPGTTIYDKLQRDLGDPNSSKYVFKGLSCFVNAPQIITGDDYRSKPLPTFQSEVRIFVFNISKFDKENANMKKINEYYGDSFFETLAQLPDLVLLMDESHHYHGAKGEQALNDLKPLLGLELTATPLMAAKKKNGNQEPFKNVVYEYPLSRAIADGYTRTPFAVTRSDVDFYNFGDEQIDKLMLQDGILCHERIRQKLQVYAKNNGRPVVKPFVLVVCKDTAHAKWVEEYIKSDAFCNGAYRSKVVVVHSKQGSAESEANTKLLLEVEKPDNPVEIVIHVDKLKEGWDVNNLYTIIPLRTAASKILREQMVGRGLRLPYGERTGDPDVDSVMLTAHDKFREILEEAQKGDSIFKAGNVIKVEEIEPEEVIEPQLALDLEEEPDEVLNSVYETIGIERSEQTDAAIHAIQKTVENEVYRTIQTTQSHTITPTTTKEIAEKAVSTVTEKPDLAQAFHENSIPLILRWAEERTEKTHRAAIAKFIPIPQIRITDAGAEEYVFMDFDIDLTSFTHEPLTNEMLIQNLEDQSDQQRIHAGVIDFDGYEPKRVILGELRKKPEIDYNKCKEMLFKLITQVIGHYECAFGTNGMQNIVMMNKRDIAEKIYTQMMQHFYCENGLLQEEVIGTRNYNLRPNFTFKSSVPLYGGGFTGDIRTVLFTDIKKGVFSEVKLDSEEGELSFARIVERDEDVLNWLRPSPKEFNITYNHGKNYEPDFVVETDDTIYLVEVKAEKDLNNPDVIAKKKRGILYCETVTHWSEANGYKPWRYLFIPANQIFPNSTFKMIVKKFTVTE
ncbi:DEAD/DEAH box helicase family protein [Ruminococcus callidus]|jgi:type III restriction enzyme|uniref:DEAD/DEAH box helicase family protein n=3 Tax=Ruminococcus callidus TaxID=40519 RepID=UPI0023F64888|nr:DEAD/DEAH box helicase family protein [Ruminococcus callidus]